MTSKAIETAREVLETRLAELGAERRQVELALRQLSKQELRAASQASETTAEESSEESAAKGSNRPKRRRRASRSKGTARSRVPRAEREAQLIELAKSEPSATNASLARTIGVTPAYVSMLIKELSRTGRLRRVDGQLQAS